MSKFTITIVEETFEERVKGKDWAKGAGGSPEEFGYTPEIKKTVSVRRDLYIQTVDELDMYAVIKAVNGITS